MPFTMRFLDELQYLLPECSAKADIFRRCSLQRSDFPAVTHLDYTARVQSVSRQTNPRFWNLLTQFKKIGGDGILVNTSFNVRGEPIVCTPHDAYKCFMQTEMDFLVVGNILLDKRKQPPLNQSMETRFELD